MPVGTIANTTTSRQRRRALALPYYAEPDNKLDDSDQPLARDTKYWLENKRTQWSDNFSRLVLDF